MTFIGGFKIYLKPESGKAFVHKKLISKTLIKDFQNGRPLPSAIFH